MAQMLIFGLGYTAGRLAKALRKAGWHVDATGSAGNLDFADEGSVCAVLAKATHILSSVPPSENGDAVLETYGKGFGQGSGQSLGRQWLGYLSSTGVYGDTGGAWVDESAVTIAGGGSGRRRARADADEAWLAKGALNFRLPGIYGPTRSALDRVREGKARRIELPDQVFSRVHVDDIVSGVIAALESGAPPGPYNLADDLPCSQNAVIEEACRLLGEEPPPLLTLEEANLSPMARGFYAENRRIANGKAKRVLGWAPKFASYRSGLSALLS
jgi:nucleoside-diphosphate-sugar epimerase